DATTGLSVEIISQNIGDKPAPYGVGVHPYLTCDKGVSEKNILWKHVFRNAMLLVIAGFPATFISMFFTGSLLIEVMFSLNGLGLLGYEATVSRDYPVMFGTLYIFTLIGLLLNILSDISYTLVDPRIDFEGR
ncbi:ABC transporter permease subunit, partial [Salmonella enterica subsp. enterica serovar Virginia]|nr:ABC transporter permease subunit [Salmonella enterica subsp. enterica serovar Virginia]